MKLPLWTARFPAPILKMLALALSASGTRILGQAMISGTNLAIALLVGWAYGAAVFGVYSFFALIALLVVNVLTAALVEPAINLAVQKEGARRRGYFAALGTVYLALVIGCMVPLHFALVLVQDFFLRSMSVNHVLVTGFVIALLTLGVLRAFFQAFADGLVMFVTDALRSFLIMSAIIAAVLAPYFGIEGDPVFIVLASQVLAVGVFVASSILYLALKGLIAAPDFVGFREHGARSGLATMIAILRFAQVNAPIFWAQYLLGEQLFGVVRTCQTLANFVSLPLFALRLHAMSTGAKAFVQNGANALTSYIKNVLVRFTGITLVLSLFMLAVMLMLPSTHRPDADSLVLIGLFLLLNLVIAANTALTLYFFAKGDLMPVLVRLVPALVISVTLAPVFLEAFSMVGAPLSILVVALLVTLLTALIIRKDRRNAG